MIKAVIFDMFETLITHYETPLYFGRETAQDMGIDYYALKPLWDGSEPDRSIGVKTIEEIVTQIMEENDCYSEELFRKIIRKRENTTVECFKQLNPGIIPMFEGLKRRGIKVGIISNCYFEEAKAIKNSVLSPYFDELCLSCELGIKKPDETIYHECMKRLQVLPEECIYVGDGGSNELEVAERLGMYPVQACWYLKEGTYQPCGRLDEFRNADSPLDILEMLDE